MLVSFPACPNRIHYLTDNSGYLWTILLWPEIQTGQLASLKGVRGHFLCRDLSNKINCKQFKIIKTDVECSLDP